MSHKQSFLRGPLCNRNEDVYHNHRYGKQVSKLFKKNIAMKDVKN